MPLSRYRVPKTARPAAFGHTIDYGLETQSSGWDRSSSRGTTYRPPFYAQLTSRHDRSCRDPRRSHRYNVPMFAMASKILATLASCYRKDRLGDPVALTPKWLLRIRITTLLPTNTLRLTSLFAGRSPYLPHHRALPGCYR
jgi:hypothetical protein